MDVNCGCVKVEVAVLGSPSILVLMTSVDVNSIHEKLKSVMCECVCVGGGWGEWGMEVCVIAILSVSESISVQ